MAGYGLAPASDGARDAHNAVGSVSHRRRHMELITILAIVAVLVVLDIAALRYGADSRIYDKTRPNW
jgi:hypothetical protein